MIDIKSILNKLLIYIPYYRNYIDSVKFIEDPNCKTGYTDGLSVYYSSKYLESVSSNDQVFLFAHELSHIGLNHMKRLGNRNMEVWNYVTDAVINQMLEECGLTIGDGLISCPDAKGKTAEEYYDYVISRPDLEDLMSKYRNNEKITTHVKWKKVNDSSFGKKDSDLDVFPDIDEKEFVKRNDEMVEEENSEFKNSFAGSITEKKKTSFSSIGMQDQILDWRTLLKRKSNKVISSDYNFFGGEFDEYGIYQYPYEVKRGCNVEILLDTSGSISDDLLKGFLREVKNILGNAIIKIACFDTKFYGPFTLIESYDDIESYVIQGRGGTDFSILNSSFSRKSNIKIVFTDGYALVPEDINKEIVWIVVDNPTFTIPGGTVYHTSLSDFVKGKSR